MLSLLLLKRLRGGLYKSESQIQSPPNGSLLDERPQHMILMHRLQHMQHESMPCMILDIWRCLENAVVARAILPLFSIMN